MMEELCKIMDISSSYSSRHIDLLPASIPEIVNEFRYFLFITCFTCALFIFATVIFFITVTNDTKTNSYLK